MSHNEQNCHVCRAIQRDLAKLAELTYGPDTVGAAQGSPPPHEIESLKVRVENIERALWMIATCGQCGCCSHDLQHSTMRILETCGVQKT